MTADRRPSQSIASPPPETRSYPILEVRALGDGEPAGSFEAFVSVFGNIDSYGDRMRLGAFTDTLQAPPAGRGFPPIVWSHDWLTPPIGATADARELERDAVEEMLKRNLPAQIEGALYVKGRLLVGDDEDHSVARQVWAGMRAQAGDGRSPLREFSFGFRSVKTEWVSVDPEEDPAAAVWDGEIRDVLKVDLYEVGPTLIGANDQTELLAAKSAVASLVQRGLVPADAVRSFIDVPRRDTTTPDPTAADRKADLSEEVRARIADLDAVKPPITL